MTHTRAFYDVCTVQPNKEINGSNGNCKPTLCVRSVPGNMLYHVAFQFIIHTEEKEKNVCNRPATTYRYYRILKYKVHSLRC